MGLFSKKNKTDETTISKKKLGKGKIAIIVAGVIVAVILISSIATAGKGVASVQVTSVTKGDIEQTVSISGTVESADTKSYYAPVSATVDAVNVATGDRVQAGDVMVLFDEGELAISKEQAQLTIQQSSGSYDNSMELAADASSKLANANANLPGVEAQIDSVQAQIDDLNNKISEKTRRMNQTATDLQKTLLDVDQDGSEDGTVDQNFNRQDDDGNEVRLQVQEALQDVQYALSNDEEIASWNRQITSLNEELTKLNEQKSELKGDESAGESGELTEGQKSYLEATKASSELTATETISDIESVEGGVKADFNGVVTEVGMENGATAQTGAKLVTIASTDDVKIKIQISKSDMSKIKEGQEVDITINGNSYTGTVSKVSGTAQNNSSGVPIVNAEIKVSNPDDNIILGVEASNKIHTDSASDVIVLPYEYVNTDTEGDFVYVVENGVLTRRDVTVGVTSGTQAEITEGLTTEDKIVVSDTDEIEIGQNVTTVDVTE